jgi:PBP1b-binding outer membrane lipoprotein LpoB
MDATPDSASTFITCTFERGRQEYVQSSMKHLSGILPLLLSVVLMVGCASDFQSTESGSSATRDSVTSNDSPSVSPPDTTAQDAIDRANAQAASDASNAAAQAAFIAGMAAAQETMNNANNQAPSN